MRGSEAYLANGETQKGWDVIVHESAPKRVQVKSIDWPTQLAVNGNLTEDFGFLVVVLLDRANSRSRFFVFPISALDSLISAPDTERAGGKRTKQARLKADNRNSL